jgi:hypothetical protein
LQWQQYREENEGANVPGVHGTTSLWKEHCATEDIRGESTPNPEDFAWSNPAQRAGLPLYLFLSRQRHLPVATFCRTSTMHHSLK